MTVQLLTLLLDNHSKEPKRTDISIELYKARVFRDL